jgi:hypothetical protein
MSCPFQGKAALHVTIFFFNVQIGWFAAIAAEQDNKWFDPLLINYYY